MGNNARLQPREGKKEGEKERKGLIMKMTTSVTSVAASAMLCALLLVFAQCASTQPSSGGGTPHKHTPHGWGSSGAYRPHQNSDNLTGRTGIPGRKMFSVARISLPQERSQRNCLGSRGVRRPTFTTWSMRSNV